MDLKEIIDKIKVCAEAAREEQLALQDQVANLQDQVTNIQALIDENSDLTQQAAEIDYVQLCREVDDLKQALADGELTDDEKCLVQMFRTLKKREDGKQFVLRANYNGTMGLIEE